MKNRIISLILALALMASVIPAIVVSAEDAATPTLEIVSKNLSYESNIRLLFAVKSANVGDAEIKLNVYEEDPVANADAAIKETVPVAYTESINSYGECDVFFTTGIAAKFLQKQLYVQAVVTVDNVTYKSQVERYSIVEYCHEMIAKDSTDAAKDAKYMNVIEYGAAIQSFLTDDGKYEGAFATDYKYVTIEDGTLDGTYDSGIYLEGEKVYPQADGASAWTSSDGKTVENKGEYVVGKTNVSFTEKVVKTYRPGTYGFEDLALGANKPSMAQYGGGGMGVNSSYTYEVMSDSVYNSASKVFKVTPSAGSKHVTLNTNVSDVASADANAFEISFDFKLEPGKETTYGALIDNAGGSAIFSLKFKMEGDGDGIYIWNNNNSSENATILSGLTSGYNHIAFKCVEKDGKVVCEIWTNGNHAYDFVTQGNACEDFTTLSKVRISSTTALGYLCLDNIYVGLVK